jgi:5'-nucleotidase
MRILLTNDDGIHAEGLAALERIARTLSDDVWIVAPETDQSGLAHSLSLSEPLRLRKISDKHFALRGTPTDCVIMGIKQVMDIKPDLVLSGVNSAPTWPTTSPIPVRSPAPSKARCRASAPSR